MNEQFHDIIPPNRRSIRNVTSSHHRTRHAHRPPEEDVAEAPTPPRRLMRRGGSFFSRFGLWVVALIVVVIFALAFSLLFAGTTVTVFPKQRDVRVDGAFQASREGAGEALAYETLSIERTASTRVPAAGREEVEDRASGDIIIFNDFSSASQRLITNTRFETPDGLIYRIDEPVEVPGQQEVNGEIVPGRVEVTVYADEPGERYNIGLTDFTIPGFKGSPRFEGFFARSKTPKSGGFVGERLTANESDVEAARNELRAELETELSSEAGSQTPEDFHLFDNAMFLTFESLPHVDHEEEVEVQERAVLHGVLFSIDTLASFIAKQAVAGFERQPITIQDPSGLNFAVVDKDVVRPWEDSTFDFALSGEVTLVWRFDETQLKNDLVGRSKEALQTILSGYEGIDRAEVLLRPFWKQTFPEDVADITIERVLEP